MTSGRIAESRYTNRPYTELLRNHGSKYSLQTNELNCAVYHTSRHTVVCCVAQETQGARQTRVHFTGVKKTPFSRICSSTLPEQKHLKFSVRIPSGWGTFILKFELNPLSFSQDIHLQSLSYFVRIFLLFATLLEIALTHAHFDGLP